MNDLKKLCFDKALIKLASVVGVDDVPADTLREIVASLSPTAIERTTTHTEASITKAMQSLLDIEKAWPDEAGDDAFLSLFTLMWHTVEAFGNRSALARERAYVTYERRYGPLRKSAIERYSAGNWKSKRQAAEAIAKTINAEAARLSIAPLSPDNAVNTVYKWLLKCDVR